MAKEDPVKGELQIRHFDEAIFNALDTQRLPFPNPNNHRILKEYQQQVHIKGVDGSGQKYRTDDNSRVVVVFHYPDHVYNRYILPGIRVRRTSITKDDERQTPKNVGYKYREPVGEEVVVNGQVGSTEYAQRSHAEPVKINYEIEVRARDELPAQRMWEYVRKNLKDKQPIEVKDSQDEPSYFMVFRQDYDDTEQLIGSLNRFNGYLITYEMRAELDDYEEYDSDALSSSDNIKINNQIK